MNESLGTLADAQWVHMMTAITVIGIVAFVFLALFLATSPARDRNVTPWARGELGLAATFREPADLDEVDQRIEFYRVRATAPVIYAPAPLAELATALAGGAVPAYLTLPTPLAELESVPVVRPVEHSSSDSPYAVSLDEFARIVDVERYWPKTPVARHADNVGRHRAPERALALAAA